MSVVDFFELFFVIAAGIAMPFIVIGSYFNLISNPDDRRKIGATIFLIISIIYALTYAYFSWRSIQKSANWKRIIEKKKTEEKKKEDN